MGVANTEGGVCQRPIWAFCPINNFGIENSNYEVQ
jgi:hypothetical protein